MRFPRRTEPRHPRPRRTAEMLHTIDSEREAIDDPR